MLLPVRTEQVLRGPTNDRSMLALEMVRAGRHRWNERSRRCTRAPGNDRCVWRRRGVAARRGFSTIVAEGSRVDPERSRQTSLTCEISPVLHPSDVGSGALAGAGRTLLEVRGAGFPNLRKAVGFCRQVDADGATE
jgi:hypothetical protein